MNKMETRSTLNEIISEYVNCMDIKNMNPSDIVLDLPRFISRYHALSEQFSDFLGYIVMGNDVKFVEIGKNGLTSIASFLEKNGKNVTVVTRQVESFKVTSNDFPCYVGGIDDDGRVFASKDGHVSYLCEDDNTTFLIHGMHILNNKSYNLTKLAKLVSSNNVIIGCYSDNAYVSAELEELEKKIYEYTSLRAIMSSSTVNNSKMGVLIYRPKMRVKDKIKRL